jgi:hypothetical protein
MGPGERVWRFTVVVPLEEIHPIKRQKATTADIANVEEMFPRHFGGFTALPPSTGYGLRDPRRPEQEPEMNYNAFYVVYSSPVRRAERYFQVLQRELQAALDEGVILIERQEVWLV